MDMRERAARLVTGAHMAAEALAEMGAEGANILLGVELPPAVLEAIAVDVGRQVSRNTWLRDSTGSGAPYTIVSVEWQHGGAYIRAQGTDAATPEELRTRALIPGQLHHVATPDELRAAGVL